MALAVHRPPRVPRGMSGPLTVVLAVLAAFVCAFMVAVTPSAPLLPIIAVLATVGLGVATVNPMAVLCVGVVVIPLEGYFPGLIGPSQAILGLGAVGWVIRWASTAPVTIPRHPALAGFAVLIVANAAGLLFAPEPFVVARQVVTWTTLFVVAFAIAHSAGERQVRQLLFAFAVAGGVAGLVATVDPQPLTGVIFQGGDVARATGGLGSPNALGMLLGLTVPVQMVFALRGTPTVRVIAAGCAALALSGMALSVSRGAFIGLAASMLVLAFWPPFRRTALLVLPLIVVLSVVGHNPASPIGGKVVERLSEATTTGKTNSRIVLWEQAPAMIADRPVFGMGGLEYGYYTAEYGIPSSEGVATHAHSLFITVVVESGIVGALGLLTLFLGLTAGLRRTVRHVGGLEQALAYALGASFFGFFVTGLLDYALGAAPIAAAFFVPVGCAIALCLNADRRRASGDGDGGGDPAAPTEAAAISPAANAPAGALIPV